MLRVNSFNLKNISKYRGELFGLAIIEIIIFHYFETLLAVGVTNSLLKLISKAYVYVLGSIGVEVFLFLSGMGIAFSLSKKHTLFSFYRDRAKRLLLPYAVIGLVFWIVRDFIILKNGVVTFILDFTLISFWVKGTGTLWYMAFIILMYAVSPAVKVCCDKLGKKSWILPLVTAVIVICIAYAFPAFFDNCEIALLRIPIYLIGFVYSERIMRGDALKTSDVALFLGFIPVYIVCILFDLPFTRFADGLYSVLLIIILILILEKLSSTVISTGLKKVGSLSLELFLTHVAIRNILNTAGITTSNIFVYVIVIAVSCVLSLVIHSAANKAPKLKV